ncbi:hypothetical protein MACH05_25470 [Qipengyuania nanhaisediminis]
MLVTPEGIALPVNIATRGSRLGALILDFLILIIAINLIELAIMLVAGGLIEKAVEAADDAVSGAAEFLIVLRIIAGFAIWYGYFLIQELGPRSATLGKRIVGIRVAARGGGRLTPEAIIARNLMRDIEIFYPLVFFFVTLFSRVAGMDMGGFIFAALIWFLIFLAFPFFNKDAMRAGDVIAGTWVVDAPRTRLARALSAQGAAASEGTSSVTGARYEFGEEELAVYGEHELQTLEKLLRDGQEEALAAVHEAICRKIGWDPGAGDERAFLEAFYAQLRARLEGGMRFGVRKPDKFS